MKPPLVRINNITKIVWGSAVATRSLNGIDMSLNHGEYVSISGPSGCGKSSLLAIIGLLDQPSSGDYWFNGEPTSQLQTKQLTRIRNKSIGFVFQEFHLIDSLSVLENVSLPVSYRRDNTTQVNIQKSGLKALEKVGAEHLADAMPAQLSGGQQQIVSVARALVNSPELLLVDEATGNLDTKSGNMVMSAIENAHICGATVCMVTHNPEYAQRAKKQYSMLDGKILGAR